jgi:hypothetical protein
MLRQPAGVALRRGRGVHVLQLDAVLDDVQEGGHVFPDAGFQQHKDPFIATKLRDLPDDQVINVGGHLRGAGRERTGDVGCALHHRCA